MQLALCCIRFQSLWNARNRSSLAFGAAPFRRAGHTVDGSKRTRKFAPIAPYEDIAFLQSHTRARAAWQAPKSIRRSATFFSSLSSLGPSGRLELCSPQIVSSALLLWLLTALPPALRLPALPQQTQNSPKKNSGSHPISSSPPQTPSRPHLSSSASLAPWHAAQLARFLATGALSFFPVASPSLHYHLRRSGVHCVPWL
mmetsp:Transcript_19942/g.42043  ORF Transcript_19942/g.42043 Transcript_19942/m.42043 type:complete len:200 (-) Transcript_19942:325-924(-)